MIVLDASVVVDLLLGTRPQAKTISREIRTQGIDLHAPHLIDAEVGHVLRRLTLSGVLRPSRTRRSLNRLARLPIVRYSHAPLLGRAFELRSNLSFYDAIYIALTEALGAILLTRDASLDAVPRSRARILVV